MRVVSQNGELDFPYDQTVIQLYCNAVVCKPISNMTGRYYALGVYSTNEKAQWAMEMLRNAYERIWEIECGNRSATKSDTCMFQFPQDSEVEV